jgi:hypothetical protein
MIESSRISAPMRGRLGPASVTNCEQPMTASDFGITPRYF